MPLETGIGTKINTTVCTGGLITRLGFLLLLLALCRVSKQLETKTLTSVFLLDPRNLFCSFSGVSRTRRWATVDKV